MKQYIWYHTKIPKDLTDIIVADLKNNEDSFVPSKVFGGFMPDKRSSKQKWLDAEHWVPSFIKVYADRANRDQFQYDLDDYELGSMQYTNYGPGDFYGWHTDQDIEADDVFSAAYIAETNERARIDSKNNAVHVRKLSFSVMLSDSYDYEGGDFEILYGDKKITAPRERGTILFFDSRVRHRVTKVKSGKRESLVGWITGPRWR